MPAPSGRVKVEVVTRVVGSLNHCLHCQVFIDDVGVGEQIHHEDMAAYPADLQAEWERLSALVWRLAARFPDRLFVQITDAQSPRGFWLALRGVRRYPAFLIGRERLFGWDEEALAQAIARQLGLAPSPSASSRRGGLP